jgi:hypothetical protein
LPLNAKIYGGIVATHAKSLMGWSSPMPHYKNGKQKTTALHSGNTGVDYVCQVSQVKKDESEHFKIESRC